MRQNGRTPCIKRLMTYIQGEIIKQGFPEYKLYAESEYLRESLSHDC